jgi:hypothetical protein
MGFAVQVNSSYDRNAISVNNFRSAAHTKFVLFGARVGNVNKSKLGALQVGSNMSWSRSNHLFSNRRLQEVELSRRPDGVQRKAVLRRRAE